MKSTLTLLALFSTLSAFSQKDSGIIHAPNALGVQPGNKSVQVAAQFPGGAPGWQKYLQKNLRAEVGAENIVLRKRQKDSLETVIVSFLVDTSGNITEVKVVNPATVTPAVGAEAVRVVQKGPNWVPATINGVKVIYRQKQSITFAVSKG
jgi:protein TonB